MKIVDYPLLPGQFVAEKTTKTHVVWHGTLGRTKYTPYKGKPGQATSSIDGWNSDDHGRVGAHYLIDRDGTVYRTMNEEHWIYHLGLKNTNGKYDKSSIGIELANELGLIPHGGKYYAFDKITKNTEYVGKIVKKNWREYNHWAKLSEKQIDACIDLTLDICKRHNIKPSFFYPSTKKRFPECFNKATICCHSNSRSDKADLYLEDWVWSKVKEAKIPLVKAS